MEWPCACRRNTWGRGRLIGLLPSYGHGPPGPTDGSRLPLDGHDHLHSTGTDHRRVSTQSRHDHVSNDIRFNLSGLLVSTGTSAGIMQVEAGQYAEVDPSNLAAYLYTLGRLASEQA